MIEKFITLEKVGKIDYAHILPWHKGLCKNIHGHTCFIDVKIYDELNENGIIRDFSEVKSIVKQVCKKYDHKLIIGANDASIIFLKDGLVQIEVGDFQIKCREDAVLIMPFPTATAEYLVEMFWKDMLLQMENYPIKMEVTWSEGINKASIFYKA